MMWEAAPALTITLVREPVPGVSDGVSHCREAIPTFRGLIALTPFDVSQLRGAVAPLAGQVSQLRDSIAPLSDGVPALRCVVASASGPVALRRFGVLRPLGQGRRRAGGRGDDPSHRSHVPADSAGRALALPVQRRRDGVQ